MSSTLPFLRLFEHKPGTPSAPKASFALEKAKMRELRNGRNWPEAKRPLVAANPRYRTQSSGILDGLPATDQRMTAPTGAGAAYIAGGDDETESR
ncbi:hypothetical protein NKG95_16915 [Mesorhizobium sp. M1423]|uniref:hypothetical protein n=1 Tax=Mesorhizobium sp. M1423 TaxID=2957101 RepID=UPI003334B236